MAIKRPLVPGAALPQQLPAGDSLHVPSGNLTDGTYTINIQTIATATAQQVIEEFVAPGGQAQFTLANTPKGAVLTFVEGGIALSSEYSVATDVVTFVTAPTAGYRISFIYII